MVASEEVAVLVNHFFTVEIILDPELETVACFIQVGTMSSQKSLHREAGETEEMQLQKLSFK